MRFRGHLQRGARHLAEIPIVPGQRQGLGELDDLAEPLAKHGLIAEHALEMRLEHRQVQERFIDIEHQNPRHAFSWNDGELP